MAALRSRVTSQGTFRSASRLGLIRVVVALGAGTIVASAALAAGFLHTVIAVSGVCLALLSGYGKRISP